MIKGLAHICFIVRDLEASIRFYRDVLGLTPAFDFVNDQGHSFGILLHAGKRCFVELFKGEPVPQTPNQSYSHCCLEVDDIQVAVAQLRAKDVEVTEPIIGSDHSWQAWLNDPDGNRIELHAYTPQSKQGPWLK
ncbi:MAG: VOC family protein [Planctomycetes bacterium]|nr:VOC family protein [Planctomycetota bacterium]